MRHTLWLWVLASLMGCPGQGDGERTPKEAPGERALRASRAVIEEGLATGLTSSRALEQYTFQIRHNPGRCVSPEFELYAEGRWTRALLRPTSPQVRSGLEALAAGNSGASTLEIMGAPAQERFRAPNGVTWPIFEVLSLQGAAVGEASPTPGPMLGMRDCP